MAPLTFTPLKLGAEVEKNPNRQIVGARLEVELKLLVKLTRHLGAVGALSVSCCSLVTAPARQMLSAGRTIACRKPLGRSQTSALSRPRPVGAGNRGGSPRFLTRPGALRYNASD